MFSCNVNADEELDRSQQFFEEDFEAFKKLSIHFCKGDTFPHYMTEEEKSYICLRAFDFNLKTTQILYEINRPKEAEEEHLNTYLYLVNSCNLYRLSENHDKFCDDNYKKFQIECKNCGNKCAKPSYCQIVEKQRSHNEQHMYLDYLEYGLPIMRQKIEKEIEKLSNENKEKKEQPQK
jgi:hypothetical protein